MPPRSRTKPLPDDEVEDTRPASVSDISDARVDLDLDQLLEQVDDLDPFTFRLANQDWTVQPPTVDQTMDAEQAPFVEDVFAILMGEQLWAEFEPVLRAQTKPGITWRLGRGMAQHFKLDAASIQDQAEREDTNRAGRRRGRGRPRRN